MRLRGFIVFCFFLITALGGVGIIICTLVLLPHLIHLLFEREITSRKTDRCILIAAAVGSVITFLILFFRMKEQLAAISLFTSASGVIAALAASWQGKYQRVLYYVGLILGTVGVMVTLHELGLI